jgi:hypothetical protein
VRERGLPLVRLLTPPPELAYETVMGLDQRKLLVETKPVRYVFDLTCATM